MRQRHAPGVEPRTGRLRHREQLVEGAVELVEPTGAHLGEAPHPQAPTDVAGDAVAPPEVDQLVGEVLAAGEVGGAEQGQALGEHQLPCDARGARIGELGAASACGEGHRTGACVVVRADASGHAGRGRRRRQHRRQCDGGGSRP
jgi:hypothetical protein